MPRSCLTCLLVLVVLTPCACDDPAPIVLGRLQTDARDAGERPAIDAAHEPEHEAGEHTDRDADEEQFEHQ